MAFRSDVSYVFCIVLKRIHMKFFARAVLFISPLVAASAANGQDPINKPRTTSTATRIADPTTADLNFTALNGSGFVQLKWTAAPGAVGYRIQRQAYDPAQQKFLPDGNAVIPTAVSNDAVSSTADLIAGTEYFDRSVKEGIQYTYALSTFFKTSAGAYYYSDPSGDPRVTTTARWTGPQLTSSELSVSNIDCCPVDFRFTLPAGASGQQLLRSPFPPPNSSSCLPVARSTTTSSWARDYDPKSPGQTWSYRLRAIFPDGSYADADANQITIPQIPPVPQLYSSVAPNPTNTNYLNTSIWWAAPATPVVRIAISRFKGNTLDARWDSQGTGVSPISATATRLNDTVQKGYTYSYNVNLYYPASSGTLISTRSSITILAQ
jgi:hypothetical protein